ncbi:HAMP domain-containing histidine kinase [Hymenobacter sp. DH14]|uniref:histidine kinase n=1 Tax=Hymenobacter cyanobacteriorum TaxID=2926463 RepID=A0A9X1VIC4_9BACT|nr:HAMP domain-containing sensor histidine kinase [Hymenobacter cyanobacteriorum]MCI1189694.1 HAMP domain-containing histidine kinase [Hymenobacter cyanobacteriorum]
MQIKHKLLLWFAGLVGALLLAFSGYVYVSNARFRRHTFAERLARKAEVTQQILAVNDSIAGSVLASLPEQVEQVYAPTDRLIYRSAPQPDFRPSLALRAQARQYGKVQFEYRRAGYARPKEGVALAYRRPGTTGQYVAVVTAYDQEGYAQQRKLLHSFVYGNLGALLLLGLLGSLFATRALAPVTWLLRQLRSARAQQLSFRLRPLNAKDEVGVLAAAFNELLTQQETLVENQRAFISQASHELRTPLTTIKGWLETSLAYDADVPALQKGIGLAVRELDKLTALANGLLHLAQLDAARTLLDGQPLELVELVLDVVDTVQHQRPGQRLDLTVADAVARQLPAPRLPGHAHLLRTALGNLLDNAAKYSGGQPVLLTLETEGAQARLLIADQGPGIDPADEERIFEPLLRGRNVGTVPGFGIGLTLAQRIIRLHGGQLRLRPRPGGGTVAEVTLPLLAG